MVSRPIELLMKVKADSAGVAPGLKGATDGLTRVEKSAEQTQKAVANISKTPIALTVNDAAIAKSRARIRELQDEIAKRKTLDINADTSDAEKEIRRLQSGVKVLESKKVTIPVDAETQAATGKIGRLAGILESAKGKAGELTSALSGLGSGTSLDGLVGILGKGGMLGGGIAAAAVAVGTLELHLGQMAADAESAQIAWKGILQNAELAKTTVADLRGFAKDTPFDFETVDKAAKTLAAYGVSTSDLIPLLTQLGDTASAVGAPLDQIARAYGQMVGKGKVSNEELLQLTEAGVPAARLLAQALGLTVEQVQDLASQGKLGADAVKLLGTALGQTFQGSMSDQAKTFNGQMSNLHDNLDQLGQTLGLLVLPFMKDLVSTANALLGPILGLVQGARDLGDKWSGVAEVFNNVNNAINPLAGAADTLSNLFGGQGDAAEGAAKQNEELAKQADAVKASLTGAAGSASGAQGALGTFAEVARKAREENLAALNAALDVSTQKLQTFFSTLGQGGAPADNFQRSLLNLKQTVEDNGKSFEGNSEKALNNRDALRNVASAAGALIQSEHDHGASAEQLGKDMEGLRTDFLNTAKAMGIPKQQAEDLAKQYGLIPSNVTTNVKANDEATAKVEAAKKALDSVNGKTSTMRLSINLGVNVDAKYAAIDRATGGALPFSVSVPPPPAPVLPASPEVSAYAAAAQRASTGLLAAPRAVSGASPGLRLALPPMTRNYTLNVTVERGVPTAEVGRSIVDQIRAFERAAGKGWRN